MAEVWRFLINAIGADPILRVDGEYIVRVPNDNVWLTVATASKLGMISEVQYLDEPLGVWDAEKKEQIVCAGTCKMNNDDKWQFLYRRMSTMSISALTAMPPLPPMAAHHRSVRAGNGPGYA